MLNDGEHIEYIDNELQLIVSKEHTFGTDALLLASFAASSKAKLACDFGTGCGIIPFYWKREKAAEKIYAVEIQKNGYEQLKRSIELNSISDIEAVNADLKVVKDLLPTGKFDLVTMNPPYTSVGDGIISTSDVDKIARHETMCTLEDVAKSASELLKFGGRLCMCIRPERLCELISAMKNYRIEPKRLRFVTQRQSLSPWLVLLEGKLGRKPGLCVMPELYIEDGGELSEDMIKIIGTYRKVR